jgi:hypothetical protein
MNARLAHEVGAHFGGDELIHPASRSIGQNFAVEIDDHAFAHGVEGIIRSAHADIGCYYRVAEGVRLVGEASGLPDGRGVARCADHDLRALAGAFPRHFREHAVMADNARGFRALRPFDDGYAGIAGLPGLYGGPWMPLAILELKLVLVVDDDAGIVGVAMGVELFGQHDEIHRPQIAPRLAHHVDRTLGLARQILRCHHARQLQLDEAEHDPIR